MLLVHIGIASMRQFQCVPTAYVNSINEFFAPDFFFTTFSNKHFLMFQCNEPIEMNKFLCSLVCTWMTIHVIDSQFYIIDSSISLDVSLEWNAKLVVAWL